MLICHWPQSHKFKNMPILYTSNNIYGEKYTMSSVLNHCPLNIDNSYNAQHYDLLQSLTVRVMSQVSGGRGGSRPSSGTATPRRRRMMMRRRRRQRGRREARNPWRMRRRVRSRGRWFVYYFIYYIFYYIFIYSFIYLLFPDHYLLFNWTT